MKSWAGKCSQLAISASGSRLGLTWFCLVLLLSGLRKLGMARLRLSAILVLVKEVVLVFETKW